MDHQSSAPSDFRNEYDQSQQDSVSLPVVEEILKDDEDLKNFVIPVVKRTLVAEVGAIPQADELLVELRGACLRTGLVFEFR